MNNQNQSILSEKDLANTVLSDLKRVVREYATAATESSCPSIRQMFTDLLNKTLSMQGQMFTAMKNSNMYQTNPGVQKQEITKQIQSNKSTNEQTKDWLSSLQQANPAMSQAHSMNNSTMHSSSTMH